MNRLLLAAPLLPILGAGAGLLIMRLNRRDEALQRRIRSVTQPKSVAAATRITRDGAGSTPGWRDRAVGLFGVVLAKRDQYPVRWPVVIAVALVLGRVATLLAEPVIGLPAWLLMPGLCVFVSRGFFARCDGKRQQLMREQLPDALGLIVRAVRVGVPVAEALRVVGRESPMPTNGEFKQLSDQLAIGIPMETALREMAVRNDLPEYAFFAAALGLQAQTGGGLTETLDLLADVTRRRVALRARGRALSAEARTSALVLGILPVVMIGILWLVSPDYINVLFVTESGHKLLGLAALLLAIGGFSMQTIIQKTLS